MMGGLVGDFRSFKEATNERVAAGHSFIFRRRRHAGFAPLAASDARDLSSTSAPTATTTFEGVGRFGENLWGGQFDEFDEKRRAR
jgi:hypothetical protein